MSVLAVTRETEELVLEVLPGPFPRRRLALFETLAPTGRRFSTLSVLVSILPFAAFLVGLLIWSCRRDRSLLEGWAWVLASLFVLNLVSLGCSYALDRSLGGWAPAVMIISGLFSMGAFLLIGLVGLGLPRIGSKVSRTLGMGLLYLLAGTPRVGCLILGYSAIFLDGGQPQAVGVLEVFTAFDLDLLSSVLLVAAIVFVGPLAEEVVFRGLLLPLLARVTSNVPAVLLSSGAFALAHVGYGSLMIQVFMIGLVLGWARLRTGGLLAPFLLHAAVNAVASTQLLF